MSDFTDHAVGFLEDIQREVLETLGEPMIKWRGGMQHIALLAQQGLNHPAVARTREIRRMKAIAAGGPIHCADEIITDDGQYRRAVRDCLRMMGEKI